MKYVLCFDYKMAELGHHIHIGTMYFYVKKSLKDFYARALMNLEQKDFAFQILDCLLAF